MESEKSEKSTKSLTKTIENVAAAAKHQLQLTARQTHFGLDVLYTGYFSTGYLKYELKMLFWRI